MSRSGRLVATTPSQRRRLAHRRRGLSSASLCRRNGRDESTLCAENGIALSIAFRRTHNLEYRFGQSGETVVSEIYFEQGPPIEKLIFVTMVAGRSDFRGSSTRSRRGLSNSNSSTTYPAVVPSENITIRSSSPSFSAFSMCVVLSVMAKRITHCKAAEYPILLILGNVSSVGIPTDKSPSSPREAFCQMGTTSSRNTARSSCPLRCCGRRWPHEPTTLALPMWRSRRLSWQ